MGVWECGKEWRREIMEWKMVQTQANELFYHFLAMWCNISKPLFLHLENGDNNSPFITAQWSWSPVFTYLCHPLLHWIRLSLRPKEYGKSDGVWLLRLGHKMYSSLSCSLWSFILEGASTKWPAIWASQPGNRNSNPNSSLQSSQKCSAMPLPNSRHTVW